MKEKNKRKAREIKHERKLAQKKERETKRKRRERKEKGKGEGKVDTNGPSLELCKDFMNNIHSNVYRNKNELASF